MKHEKTVGLPLINGIIIINHNNYRQTLKLVLCVDLKFLDLSTKISWKMWFEGVEHQRERKRERESTFPSYLKKIGRHVLWIDDSVNRVQLKVYIYPFAMRIFCISSECFHSLVFSPSCIAHYPWQVSVAHFISSEKSFLSISSWTSHVWKASQHCLLFVYMQHTESSSQQLKSVCCDEQRAYPLCVQC